MKGSLGIRVAVGVSIMLLLAVFLPKPNSAEAGQIPIPASNLTAIFVDPNRPYVYVSDSSQNCVHILNTSTYQIEKSISVGQGPAAMDIKEDNSLLFVILTGGSQVAVIDLDAQSALSPIDLPGSPPNSIAVGTNDKLYVGMGEYGWPNSVGIFDISSLPPIDLGTLPVGGQTICGRSADRRTLYTRDRNDSYPNVIQWDISSAPPTQVQSNHPYGGGNDDPGPIVSNPSDTQIYVLANGSAIADGVLPIHRPSDLSKIGQFNVEWTPIAVGVSSAGDVAYVAHTDWVLNPTYDGRHDRHRRDLHIFDTSAFAEKGYYALPDFVHEQGIAIGPDDRIYLLLGRDIASDIWVIDPDQPAYYDATGTWTYSSINNWVDPGTAGCLPMDDATGTVTVAQTDNTVTMVDDDGYTWTGTVTGADYAFSTSFPEDGGTFTAGVSFTLSSSTSGSGTVTWLWTDGVVSCNGGSDLTVTKGVIQPAGDGDGGDGCFIATVGNAAY